MKKVVVIGSNSFSGSHLINFILENTDYVVIGISRSPEYSPIFLPYLYKKSRPKNFQFQQLDLNKDLNRIFSIFETEKPEFIINFAAQGEVQHSWENPGHWFRTNSLGIANLTNGLKDKKYLKKYVHISTPEVYGSCEGTVKENLHYYNPSTPYAASKASGDLFLLSLVKTWDFPLVMIRSTNVYGKHQQLYRIIPRTIIYLKQGKKIKLHGGGYAIKSFIHIKDVVRGIFKAYNHDKTGELYHLSPKGEGYSIRQIVKKICDKMGYNFEKSTECIKDRKGQDAKYVIDSTKARKNLDWNDTINIDEGINEMIDWIEENWKAILMEPLEYIHKE
jgi:dTDP-glucose 4,6-dehydratase